MIAHALPIPAHSAHQDGPTSDHEAKVNLGMWVFLTTEILFFGVLFVVYVLGRLHFPDAFQIASRRTNLLLGTLNTAVLLTSSLTIALAARAAMLAPGAAVAGPLGERSQDLHGDPATLVASAATTVRRLLYATAALGAVFLCLKLGEYWLDFREHLVPGLGFDFTGTEARGAAFFFGFYFVSTGLHAVHLVIGIGLVLFMGWRVGCTGAHDAAPSVEVTGLYWHFVDLVWIFLYPCLYLVSRA
ncbi:MAG: cytochrome c oxidase subunit 3 [Pseudomonadota bacterium]|nr:cytochrome c oxidase subunit 3 [Pseudomonadota bacterium]